MKGNDTKKNAYPGFTHIDSRGGISEYVLNKNGLRVLYMKKPGTGIVTSNILYFVGSRDEQAGHTGLAHMLEHMLFKPTKQDLARKIDSLSMQFERETGVILNANTWKDRTTYYFSYPREHFKKALQIEAERMRDVVFSEKECIPERDNVLSEYDMYNGDPYFALEVAVRGSVFHAHPYGHETIGYRNDIEQYTPAKLQAFYDIYYWPDNAMLMVVGDIELQTVLAEVKKQFSHIPRAPHAFVRHTVREAPQEGMRRVHVARPSETRIFLCAFRHAPFPSKEWYTLMMLFNVLAEGEESVLHKALIDTGKAASVKTQLEPTKDEGVAMIYVTLAKVTTLQKIEKETLHAIYNLKEKDIKQRLETIRAKALADEFFGRDSSLNIVAELVEYASAGRWQTYFETEKMLRSITAKDILALRDTLFKEKGLTIGTFAKEL